MSPGRSPIAIRSASWCWRKALRIFGIRLGFRDRDTAVFRTRSHSLEGVATYMWSTTVFQSARGYREIVAAEDGSAVLQCAGRRSFAREQASTAPIPFWPVTISGKRSCARTPPPSGERFEIGGRSLRLTGVMPRSFSFLSDAHRGVDRPPAREPAVHRRRWWLALRGAVGASASGRLASRRRKRTAPDSGGASASPAPISSSAPRPSPIWFTAPRGPTRFDLLLSTSLILLWAGFNVFRDRRRGASWQMTRRFWGFFVLKTMLPLIALFLFVFEFGGVTQLGVTGGVRPGSGASRRLVLLLRHRRDLHLGLARSARPLPRLPASHAPAPAHRRSRPDPARNAPARK